MTRTWRLSADNCLVYGASLFAGRKYFLPTGTVGYRIHGKNGWWSNRGNVERYLNRLRSRDFDMLVGSFPQSTSPGNEQREFWKSSSAG